MGEAIEWFHKRAGIGRALDGRHDEETEFALAGLGTAYVAHGEPRRAVPLLERALGLQHGDETASDRADTELALAQALTAFGRDAARAHDAGAARRATTTRRIRSARGGRTSSPTPRRGCSPPRPADAAAGWGSAPQPDKRR